MQHTLISSTTLRKHMLGGVSAMTIWRWLNDPNLCFPRPIYIGRRRFWREADVNTWIEERSQLSTQDSSAAEKLVQQTTPFDMANLKPRGGRHA